MQSNLFILDIPDARSSLVERLEFDDEMSLLYVLLRYKKQNLVYQDVPWQVFQQMCESDSIGRYYLNYIKPNFKLLKNEFMAERPKTKNLASNQKRFIKISINVRDIKKEWLHEGEKGTYLAITLHMLPDGTIDKYGNLGMITQDVPKSVYEQDKKAQGPILGNAAELDWQKNEGIPGQETGSLISPEVMDDLPF